ncbi:patatin-like phospholipase family protein [Leifsonia sp. LS-T14]|uniref:patatin-like phospholipase family protein n=1 Tax=unclassified Leifsonia TaxID=2663824 RepID=UPI0035A681FA
MNTPSSPLHSPIPASPRDRALVLGGGGSTGNAWLIGVVAGLYEAGVDVTAPDLTIGTSAGSTAAAGIADATPADLYAAALTLPSRAQTAPAASGASQRGAAPVVNHLERLTSLIAASTDAADYRRRLCASALELDAASDGSWSERWRSTVAARLPRQEWPDRRIQITAVDARTSEPVVFDRDSGVGLADAIAASCSSGLPYRIGDERYLDGGFRANAENADLAAGYARVLVMSPFGGRSLTPAAWGTDLAAQVAGLRASGSHVETVVPDEDSEHLFGPNGMDITLRPAAARAGYAQAASLAARLSPSWT